MQREPNYKTAYETLANAIDEAGRILDRAQIMTAYSLSIQQGDTLSEEDLQNIEDLKSGSE